MMIEQVFHYAITDEKTLEQAVKDNPVHINHMVLPEGEGFPEHIANATVYMTVIRGHLSITPNGEPAHSYRRGDILKIPQGTLMRGENPDATVLELLVVKLFTC